MENEIRIGTHTSHCCATHGCKYGEDRCPVELKTHEQEYPCEFCKTPEALRKKIAVLQEELKEMEALEARLGPWRNW